MIVLVDTTIWSLALRRRPAALGDRDSTIVEEWARLVRDGRATLAGPIRQEILSGIKDPKTFRAIQERLDKFRYVAILAADYDQAAAFFNRCRAGGIAATGIDMLLCAIAARLEIPIFTVDGDFALYARVLPIELHAG